MGIISNSDTDLNTGVLIACRRPQAKFKNTADNYVCCNHCKGFFSKKTLRIHYKNCNPVHKKSQESIHKRQTVNGIHILSC